MTVGKKRALGMTLAAALIAYLILIAVLYSNLTAPSSLYPDFRELDRLIFDVQRQSRIEQLLQADGERIESGGTMRPAFHADSTGWEQAIQNLSEQERIQLLEQREGERQALLDWVRGGASREAYDRDNYSLLAAAGRQITATYRISESASDARVKIRSLISDRCVTCHSENGRHDTARFIPLDSYERLAPRLKLEAANLNRTMVIAAMMGLMPLGFVAGLGFWISAHSLAARALMIALTFTALALMLACFFLGRQGTWHGPALLGATVCAACAIAAQSIAIFEDLRKQAPGPGEPKTS
jgi:hypothetical protein